MEKKMEKEMETGISQEFIVNPSQPPTPTGSSEGLLCWAATVFVRDGKSPRLKCVLTWNLRTEKCPNVRASITNPEPKNPP